MFHFFINPDLYNISIRLTQEEQQYPLDVLRKFFTDYSLHELRTHQSHQLEACLTTDNVYFSEPGQRADLIYFHEQMEKLLEAVFLLTRLDMAKE